MSEGYKNMTPDEVVGLMRGIQDRIFNINYDHMIELKMLDGKTKEIQNGCPHSKGWAQHPVELMEVCNLCGVLK